MNLSKVKRYSPNDHRLFKLIPKKKGGIDSKKLVHKFYRGDIPLNGQQCVMAGVRALKRKIEFGGEPFALITTPRRGPHPIMIWIERKAR